jgi:hypothetical protein
VLSACALAVAVLGTTPLGHAAGRALSSIPPFARKAGYATVAGNSLLLNGHRAAASGAGGTIPVLDAHGKLPASIGAVGPQGAQGPAGAAGPAGAQGPPGPVDTSELLGRTITVGASNTLHQEIAYRYVLCPSGYEAVGGGAWADDNGHADTLIYGSAPTDGNGVPVADGHGGPPRGWGTSVDDTAPSTISRVVHWTVVCAKEGT